MNRTVLERVDEGQVDFVIVGAMKAGTSTLARQLRSHPAIGVARREVHYFSRANFYEQGPAWYRKRLQSGLEPEISIIGEKSACYSHSKLAPERMRTSCPDVKLLWILRNPVDRAYSHYFHVAKRAAESQTFAEAVADLDNQYVRRSRYIVQVRRFLKHFPLEQMHFMLLDDMKDPETDHLKPVLEFLGVEPTEFVPPVQQVNRTVVPRYQFVLKGLGKIAGRKSPMFFRAERFLRKGQTAGYEPMDPDVRKKLVKYFAPQNKKLGSLIGRDLSMWNR